MNISTLSLERKGKFEAVCIGGYASNWDGKVSDLVLIARDVMVKKY